MQTTRGDESEQWEADCSSSRAMCELTYTVPGNEVHGGGETLKVRWEHLNIEILRLISLYIVQCTIYTVQYI